ncbi:DUF222 domain-containing protein [Actinoplanes sp. GCM10030250]|uniref:HNH endonuclease signature motif containing protein n=1 Tax=Actinoplanes sp. GCM10030250 TaxID=3273376 RepID=UPI00361072DD
MGDTGELLTAYAGECAAASTWSMPEHELLAFLESVHTAQQMLHAALLHAVRELEGRAIPAAQGATSPHVWLRGRLRISIGSALRLLTQAKLLTSDPALDAAVIAGRINAEQLDAITKVLGDLPAKLDDAVRAEAAATLASWAPQLDPHELRKAGKRILAHVAPEVEEAAEEDRLRREEREAHEQRHFTLSPLGDGRVRLRGLLDVKAAAVVSAAIDPLCKPSDAADELAGSGTTRTPEQRRADAFVEVCRMALAGGNLPENGGDRPQLTITASYDVVRRELRGGVTDSGDPVSAATVRQMACDARILPLVFDGESQVLDAGRSRRLVTGTLRRALNARDRGCTFPGCDRPDRWCDAHHVVSWADGGRTDLSNVVLVCEHHHRAVHEEGGWRVRIGDGGTAEYVPPAWLDPEQVPRRNSYHRRT